MELINLAPPSGTRDFLPSAVKARERVLSTVRAVFERFGFLPVDTPAFERLEILMGKYGEEGDKLIFKILKRGGKAATGESDVALRYDLTIPLARIVALNPQALSNNFRRYHIGPVWRADRPARGRFREFYQCDVDIVGSTTRTAEAEVLLALTEALAALKIQEFTIRVNSRKVLKGLMECYGLPEDQQTTAITVLDKLDKIGPDGVISELVERNVNQHSIDALSNDLRRGEELAQLRTKLQSTEAGREGLAEVDELLSLVAPMLKAGSLKFDAFLARGLSYYTGNIFEVVTESSGLSIASGGRYDDLIGMFAKSSIPACGGSLGIERIMALLPQDGDPHIDFPKVLVTVWDSSAAPDALRFAAMLRESDISTEVYVGSGNIGRQIKYAAGRNIPVCIIQGPDEKTRDRIIVKDMKCHKQIELSPNDAVAHIQKLGDVDTLASHALQAGLRAGSARNIPGETVERAQQGDNLRSH